MFPTIFNAYGQQNRLLAAADTGLNKDLNVTDLMRNEEETPMPKSIISSGLFPIDPNAPVVFFSQSAIKKPPETQPIANGGSSSGSSGSSSSSSGSSSSGSSGSSSGSGTPRPNQPSSTLPSYNNGDLHRINAQQDRNLRENSRI
jgi:uncharacterized membrane protein YgcG